MRSFLKTLLFLIAGTAFARLSDQTDPGHRSVLAWRPVDVVMRLLSPKMTEC